ncbi:MAG TPA: GDSL-type esterase/lipase family protein [Bacillota bacterium]|nr:GDSL-type esterase/lipase family protein [Bacillota bacterium]
MSNKKSGSDYDKILKITIAAAAVALAVLIILVIMLFSGAPKVERQDGGISETISGSNSGTAPATSQPAAETTEADTIPVTQEETSNTAEPVTETEPAETEPPETVPVDLVEDTIAIPRYMGLSGIEKEFPGTVLTKTDDMGEDYLRRIVFLGDSLTYGLKTYGMLEGGKQTTQVWVPTNGTLLLNNVADAKILYPETGTEITVREAVAAKKPDILIISLGINGISFLGEKDFIAQFTSLIKEVKKQSPDTTIILQSMFPVAASYQLQKSINNNKICRGNYWMAKAASQNGVYYLNTAETLVGPDGYLPENYQSGDGLHLNTTAYKIVLDYIRTHGVK